mmetsp:Transcript_36487/g.48302  ORF Transcript_36487/g.48302 Transcript_36487/m.48302 type:complete len:138 (+) Transcript_36487:249-662(+)
MSSSSLKTVSPTLLIQSHECVYICTKLTFSVSKISIHKRQPTYQICVLQRSYFSQGFKSSSSSSPSLAGGNKSDKARLGLGRGLGDENSNFASSSVEDTEEEEDMEQEDVDCNKDGGRTGEDGALSSYMVDFLSSSR